MDDSDPTASASSPGASMVDALADAAQRMVGRPGTDQSPVGQSPAGQNIVGLGVDLAEIDRVRHLLATYGESFRRRCFTDHEWEYANRYADPSKRLAARFAGKEAVMKSLGAGWRHIHWKDVEITGGGAPRVNLAGTAAARAARIGVTRVLVTITHTEDSALVFAVSLAEVPVAAPSPARPSPAG